jgi:hypothetical protein
LDIVRRGTLIKDNFFIHCYLLHDFMHISI